MCKICLIPGLLEEKCKNLYFLALVFPKTCKMEVGWMFKHLDLDMDGQLTLQELYDIEHDQNEYCIKPFLDMCDTNR